jgi:hypothetical protein
MRFSKAASGYESRKEATNLTEIRVRSLRSYVVKR